MEVPYFLSKYDPDALRFYLTATAPETRDTEPALSAAEGSAWEDFVERNNPVLSRSPEQREGANEGNELAATHSLRSVQAWGNLCQRPRRTLGFMLSFTHKRFDGVVPVPGALDEEDRTLPEDDPGADPAAHACATHTAQKLHEYLGYEGQPFGVAQGRLFGTHHVIEYQEEVRQGGLRSHRALTYDHSGATGTHSLRSVQAWAKSELPPGQALREPAPLFKKLDESVIDEEYARLGG